MAFYVIRNGLNGAYLSMRCDGWVLELEAAAVFTLRRTAEHAIHRQWQRYCSIERIGRLPERIPVDQSPLRFTRR
jgi:hypothetical protein